MRVLGLLLVAALMSAAWAGSTEPAYDGADPILLAQVREEFETAPESAAATRKLIAVLDETLPAEAVAWPPVFRAYRAALEALMGKHSWNPWQKHHRAKAGLARFQGLVEAHPESIEIRMLRYSSSSQLPDFFGLRPQAESDLAILVALFERGTDPMVPARQCRGYIQWILDHGHPPPALKARLEKLLHP